MIKLATRLCLGVALFNAPGLKDSVSAQDDPLEHTLPVFKDGEAQIVDGFKDEKDWIRHDLWVEAEFDSDADGRLDRMHVAVTRPKQTETEGLKLPVVYESSPYFAGTGTNDRRYFWNPRQGVDEPPPPRVEGAVE